MKKSLILAPVALAAALLLAACGGSTGVLPVGPDTYTISAAYRPMAGGGQAAQREVLTEGNTFCAQQGKTLSFLQMGPTPVAFDQPIGYSATFRCLAPGDPELRRPAIVPAPNVVVEQRYR